MGRGSKLVRGGDELLDWLHERLTAAGYRGESLRRLLGIRYPDDIGMLNHAPTLERLRADDSVLAVLCRLFFLEEAEPRLALERVFSAREQGALISGGLLESRGRKVVARLRIDVVGDLSLLADRRFRGPDMSGLGLPAGDAVYPPGADSVILSEAASALQGKTVLDLCTGSGVQGLLLASRAKSLHAVDIGKRSSMLAAVNARLNHVPDFTVWHGNLYRPVREQRFELIVANPPFVASPRRGPAYHSGGPTGDHVLRRVVAGLGKHLRPGGRGIVISHLALRTGEKAIDRISPWLGDFGGRALVLLLEAGTAVDLAAAQALFALGGGFAAYAREVRKWVRFLERHGVVRIVLLLLVVERSRRRGTDVVEAFQRSLSLPLTAAPAEHVARWLQA